MASSDTNDFQFKKELVCAFHVALDFAVPEAIGKAISEFVASDWRWHGMHPFNDQQGPEPVATLFWAPLK